MAGSRLVVAESSWEVKSDTRRPRQATVSVPPSSLSSPRFLLPNQPNSFPSNNYTTLTPSTNRHALPDQHRRQPVRLGRGRSLRQDRRHLVCRRADQTCFGSLQRASASSSSSDLRSYPRSSDEPLSHALDYL